MAVSSFEKSAEPLFRPVSFPNPYQDLASSVLPTTIQDALKWGEFIANTNGIYRSALRRVCSYCVTDIEVVPDKEATSELDQKKRERYLNMFSSPRLDAKRIAVDFAMALLVYGNVFVSLHTKFERYLECPKCHAILNYKGLVKRKKQLDPGKKDTIDVEFRDYQFYCTCPSCKKRGAFLDSDSYSEKPEDLYIRFWDPHDIELRYDYFTGESRVVWKIPAQYRGLIRSGDLEALATCPKNVIDVIRDNSNLTFDPDAILHCKENALPGIQSNGWGIPRAIVNFRAAWYWKLIESYNERLATDFIMPTRCLSPASAGGDSPADPILSAGISTFVSNMELMIKQHEADPNSWLISPTPVQYQTLGGDAAKFMPKEQLEHGMNVLLSSSDIPVDMFSGTMTMQSAPTSLRLFETVWGGLVSDLNRFLQFMADRAAFILDETPVCLRFKRISHADDLTRQQAVLQLMSAGELSRTSGLASIGFDKQEENRLQLEEDRAMAELQQKQQEDLETTQMFQQMVPNGTQVALSELQQQQQGGMAPPGGGGMPAGAPPAGGPMPGPMPMGGASPIDQMLANAGLLPTDNPEDILEKARTIANQIWQAGPQRASLRRQLKSRDPQLHSVVSGLLDDMDQQAEQQGKQMMMQQGGPPPV